MPFTHYCPDINNINVCLDDILEMLRETDHSYDNPVVCETEIVYGQLRNISDIRGGYMIYDDVEVLRKEGKIRVNDREIEPGAQICGYMEDIEKLAVFICTAGEGFSSGSDSCNKQGDYLKSFVIDTFGSLVVEKATDYIQEKLEKEVRACGMQTTNRYSPGYCNWPVQDQKQLFSLLPDNSCKISLSESCLMLPIKSISGIIGIGKKVRKREYSCDVCTNRACIYRKVIKNHIH